MNPSNENTHVRQALRQANEHINSARPQQAEGLVRQILHAQPDNHEALNMLGVIALNSGHSSQAVEIFSRAVQLHDTEAEYHCNLGVAMLNDNRTDEGEAALQAALKFKPSHAMANFNLGLFYMQAGRFENACKRLDKAVKKMPHNVAALNALGVAHSKCNTQVKAVRLFRSVLKSQPDHTSAKLNLAGALTEMGKTDEAINLYNGLIAQQPDNAQLHFNLGVALCRARRELDAIDAYQQALALAPQFADAHVNLSAIYANRGNQDTALEHIQAAGALRPDDIHIMTNEARVLLNAGLGSKALATCDRVLALAPDNAYALGIRVRVLQNDGRFTDATAFAAQALAVNPHAVDVLIALSNDKNYAFSGADIQTLKNLAMDDTANTDHATRAWFALGKIHHDRGEIDQAFNCYKRGNARRDAVYNWSETDEQTFFDSLINTFTEDFFQKRRDMGSDSERPIFIVGMPRSGTTLVEQIISSHPHAEGGGELFDIMTMTDTLAHTLNSAAPYPACTRDMTARQTDELAAQYSERLARVSGTAARVTDKMPENYLHLGLIALLFPKARIIHCRRDPMANCFSIYQQNFSGYHPYAYDLAKLGRRYRIHDRLMEHWHQVLPLPILEVAYEDVVDDQEYQSRRIMEFCALDWDDAVLDFHSTARTVQTASLWQVRQPIYTSSLKGWQAYRAFLDPLKDTLNQN